MSVRTGIVVAVGIAVLASVVWAAYTVTQSYNSETQTYIYDIRVSGDSPPVRDFHLKAPKGTKLKVASVTSPGSFDNDTGANFQSHAPNPQTGAAGWHSPPAGQSTTGELSWYTDDDDAGEEGDSDRSDDPTVTGRTLRVQVQRGEKAETRMCTYFVTTDEKPNPPSGPGGGTVPGPVAAVTPSPSDETPPPNSSTPVTLTSTEDNMAWEVYLAAAMSQEGDPQTDPLGIGINTNDRIPPQYEIAVTPHAGTWGAPPPPTPASAVVQLTVGSAPSGYRFYMVLTGKSNGEIVLFSDPVEFVVTP